MWLFFFEILSCLLTAVKTSPVITILLLLFWFIVLCLVCDRIGHFSGSMSRLTDSFGFGVNDVAISSYTVTLNTIATFIVTENLFPRNSNMQGY